MKKLMLLLILTTSILTCCKKEKEDLENYKFESQTSLNNMFITITGSMGFKDVHLNNPEFEDLSTVIYAAYLVDNHTMTYHIMVKDKDKVYLNFRRLNGEIMKIEFIKSNQRVTITR
jgi:hypothetical protein